MANEREPTWIPNRPVSSTAAWDIPASGYGPLSMPGGMRAGQGGAGSYSPMSGQGIGQAWNWQGSDLSGIGSQLGNMSAKLNGGPGNAFSQSQLNSMDAGAQRRLQTDNRQFMGGVANANAGRGVAGNPMNALMQQQMSAVSRGAQAGAGLQSQIAGMEMGLNQYNSLNSAFGNVGNLYNAEAGRNFDAQQTERASQEQTKQNAYDRFKQADAAFNDAYKQYTLYMQGKPRSGAEGRESLSNIRAVTENLRDERNRALAEYNATLGGGRLPDMPEGMKRPPENVEDGSQQWW